jgi:hypothetical protein
MSKDTVEEARERLRQENMARLRGEAARQVPHLNNEDEDETPSKQAHPRKHSSAVRSSPILNPANLTSTRADQVRARRPQQAEEGHDNTPGLLERLTGVFGDYRHLFQGPRKLILFVILGGLVLIVAVLVGVTLFSKSDTAEPPSFTAAIEQPQPTIEQQQILEEADVPIEATTAPNTPPEAPQAHIDAIDAGSTNWKGNSQWLQYAFLGGCLLLLVVDTAQKTRLIKDDTRRGGGQQIRLRTIWFAPVLVVLGALFLVGSQWQIIQPALFGAGHKLAITYAVICWTMAYIIAEGDSSYPAMGMTITALWHLLTAEKTGAFLLAFKIPAGSVMFNIKDTFDLMTLNHFEMAKFSLLIYCLLVIPLFLLGYDLVKGSDHHDPHTLVAISIAVIGGIAIFSAGRWIQPVWSIVILLVTGLAGQAIDIENFDEGLMGAIVVGSFVTLAFAAPLPL